MISLWLLLNSETLAALVLKMSLGAQQLNNASFKEASGHLK